MAHLSWMDAYTPDHPPTWEDACRFINSELWQELHRYLQETYRIEPAWTYSGCSGQPGWNMKYKKGGKALCTLYPMENFFITLVVVGQKEMQETELMLPSFTPYTQALYKNTTLYIGTKWLMMEIRDADVLEDAKRIMHLRVKPPVNKKI